MKSRFPADSFLLPRRSGTGEKHLQRGAPQKNSRLTTCRLQWRGSYAPLPPFSCNIAPRLRAVRRNAQHFAEFRPLRQSVAGYLSSNSSARAQNYSSEIILLNSTQYTRFLNSPFLCIFCRAPVARKISCIIKSSVIT